MQKIEDTDLNKFLIAIGLVLMVCAITAPYLYLKEDFGMYLSQHEFDSLQQSAKALVIDKQDKIKKLQTLFFCVPLVLSALGLLFLSIGLYRWFERPPKIDKNYSKKRSTLNPKTTALSKKERDVKVMLEILEIEHEKKAQPDHIQQQLFEKYIQVEDTVTQLFKHYNSKNFEILPQQKMGTNFEIDILLKSRIKDFADRIIDIKYFNDTISESVLNSTLHKLNSYVTYYKQASGKAVVPVLIIVYRLDQIMENELILAKVAIKAKKSDFPNLKGLKTQFLEENTMDTFEVKKVLNK